MTASEHRAGSVGSIATVGDPVLRERAREITPEELRSPEVQGLVDDLIATMRAAGGAGLVANRVGELRRVAVVEVDHNPRYPYLHGGIGIEPDAVQRRFRDDGAEAWAARVDALAEAAALRVGAAVHSVRAVDPASARTVAAWAAARDRPLHAHVSEQPVENEACVAAYGRTPVALLCDAGAISERSTAVHATHVTADDMRLLGEARATVCLCPTTERDLADGIGPARRLRAAGARLAVGSDSQAVITCSRRPGRSSSTSDWPRASAAGTVPPTCWARRPPGVT